MKPTPQTPGDQPEVDAAELAQRLADGESLSDIMSGAPRPENAATQPVPDGGQASGSASPVPNVELEFGKAAKAAQEAAREALVVEQASAPAIADALAGEPAAASGGAPAAGLGTTNNDDPIHTGGLNIQHTSLPVLYQVSADFVLVTGGGAAHAYRIATGAQMAKEGFVQFCSKHYGDVVIVNSEGVTKSVSSGAAWWNWNDATKRVVERVVLEPTSAAEGSEDADPTVFNRWYVLKHEMAAPNRQATLADIEILINHLMYISDGDREGVMYFLNWLACLWQFPDIKIPTAIMMYSRRGRVGKSILAKLLAHVFGKSMVKSCDGLVLHKNFMDAVEHKRLVVLNELSRSDKQDSYERFKSMISEETMEFEAKGKASREIRNIAHYMVTTNNADALPLMENDGRILVLRCEGERKPDEYYAKLANWIDGDGPELLAGVLDQWKFPADFDPYAPVPQTAASKRTQLESRSPLCLFIHGLIEECLPPFDMDMGKCRDLVKQLNTLHADNVRSLRLNDSTLLKALKDLGAVNLVDGGHKGWTAWCWRNQSTHQANSHKEWQVYVEGSSHATHH